MRLTPHETDRLLISYAADLVRRNVAASVVLPGDGTLNSHSRWTLQAGGELDVDLEPTIVAADARHGAEVRIELAGTARLRAP